MRVACVGGLNRDIRARSDAALERGTSNSGTVSRDTGGVAGNIARTLGGLGAGVAIFSVVGADAVGATITAGLRHDGVDTDHLRATAAAPTSTYVALLDESGELVGAVADMGAMDQADTTWIEQIEPDLAAFDAWAVDANLPASALERLLVERPSESFVLVDPVSSAKALRLRHLLPNIDVLTPDRSEAATLTGRDIENRAGALNAAAALVDAGATTVLLKLGSDGLVVADATGTTHLDAIPPRRVVDVTGAGDALAAGYLYGISIGARNPERWGLAAASLTVETSRSVAEGLSVDALRQRMSADAGR
jgi:pseudouridine kinase